MNYFLLLIYLTAGPLIVYRNDRSRDAYRELGSSPQFDCVGRVLRKNDPAGSCVFIGGRYVVSAAHCFMVKDYQPVKFRFGGEVTKGYLATDPHPDEASNYKIELNGRKYRIKKITIHPVYLAHGASGDADIAVLTLAEEVKGLQPAVLNTSFDERNSVATGVGYGGSLLAEGQEEADPGERVRLAGTNVIDSVGGFELNEIPTRLCMDFDHPLYSLPHNTGDTLPQNLEYCTTGGDSGGGIFREVNGKWELLGIHSQIMIDVPLTVKHGYYGSRFYATRISAFYGWIDAVTDDGDQ